jgi:hypothetical protein
MDKKILPNGLPKDLQDEILSKSTHDWGLDQGFSSMIFWTAFWGTNCFLGRTPDAISNDLLGYFFDDGVPQSGAGKIIAPIVQQRCKDIAIQDFTCSFTCANHSRVNKCRLSSAKASNTFLASNRTKILNSAQSPSSPKGNRTFIASNTDQSANTSQSAHSAHSTKASNTFIATNRAGIALWLYPNE